MTRRFSQYLAMIVLLSGSCAAGFAQAKTPPPDPTFKLQSLDGKVVDLNEQRGNVVLVSFGATWCAPCTVELQSLNELLTEYRNQPVKFFWVSVERADEINNSRLKQYAKERKLAFPVLRDTGKMVYMQFAERQRLPMILLLDKDGKVDTPVTFGVKSPPQNYKAEVRARLNKLLNLPSVAAGGGLLSLGADNRVGLPKIDEAEGRTLSIQNN